MDTIGGKALHHLRIDDPSVVGASNTDTTDISDLHVETGRHGLLGDRRRDARHGEVPDHRHRHRAQPDRPTSSIVGRYEFSDVGKAVTIVAPIP